MTSIKLNNQIEVIFGVGESITIPSGNILNGDNFLNFLIVNNVGELIESKTEVYRRITREDRYSVLKRQFWRCNICGKKLKYCKNNPWEAEVAHIDHIHPFTKSDSYPNGALNINELSNLQALCPDCNLKKSKKEVN